MSESVGLQSGRAAVSRILGNESNLKALLEQAKAARINIQTCDFRQVESFLRDLSPPADRIPARGGRAVVSYQDLAEAELEVLQRHFRQEVQKAKEKHPNLFL